MTIRFKEYLGDAVYAGIDELGRLVLTTEDGIEATNTIILELEVLEALERYVAERRREVQEARRT